MTDYEKELLEGTPEVTDEMRQQVLLEQEQNRNRIQELEQVEAAQPTQEVTPKATAPEAPVEPKPIPEPKEAEPSSDELLSGVNPEAKALANLMDAPGQSILDFGADLLNMIPNVDAPKESPYENQVAQTVREISSVVIPTITIGGIGTSLLTRATQGLKFFADPGLRHIGKVAFGAGSGAFVDYTVEINQEDDNIAGALKKSWPRWFGWIPNDIATIDTDSPDVKRAKNVTEGVGIGVGTDILLGLAKLAKGVRGITRSTQWVPENEMAKNWFAKKFLKDETPEEVVNRSAGKRAEAMDELGQYNLEKSVNLDEPIYGVHDVWGYQEMGTRSADDLGAVGVSIDAVRIEKNYDSVYGRVGSVVTESALKKGLESSGDQEILIRGIASELQDAGEYGYNTASGKYISHAEVMETGEKIAADELRKRKNAIRNPRKRN